MGSLIARGMLCSEGRICIDGEMGKEPWRSSFGPFAASNPFLVMVGSTNLGLRRVQRPECLRLQKQGLSTSQDVL